MSTENKECDLSNVVLQVSENANNGESRRERRPKRVLHFSDGDLVEYSDEEPDCVQRIVPQQNAVNVKNLGWIPWTWYQTTWAGNKVVEGCDYVGEALAHFLGITTPKYQFEIEEYQRQQKIREDEERQTQDQMEGWNNERTNPVILNDLKTSE